MNVFVLNLIIKPFSCIVRYLQIRYRCVLMIFYQILLLVPEFLILLSQFKSLTAP